MAELLHRPRCDLLDRIDGLAEIRGDLPVSIARELRRAEDILLLRREPTHHLLEVASDGKRVLASSGRIEDVAEQCLVMSECASKVIDQEPMGDLKEPGSKRAARIIGVPSPMDSKEQFLIEISRLVL
jgi:hypothetical protein